MMALPMAMTALPMVIQSVVLSAVWSMVEFFRVGVEEPVELWFEDGERGDVVAESGLPDLGSDVDELVVHAGGHAGRRLSAESNG